MNRAIEAFEREFAPWALKLPATDVAARRNGQLRINGWSVLYEFGSDAYGDYLDYYAALRGATDARVNDDWHARIYETGQIVAFPAVLEAYLYGRDPSPEELDRARAPVLESLAPAPSEAAVEGNDSIGTADTALWEDLREVVEAEVAGVAPAPQPPPAKDELPRRPSAETPAEIESVLDAAFGDLGKKPLPEEQVKRPTGEQAPIERDARMSAAPSATAPQKNPKAPAPPQLAKAEPKTEPQALKVKVEPPKPKVEPPKPKVEAPKPKVEAPKPKVEAAKPEVEQPAPEEPKESEAPSEEQPVGPRRSVPGYDPFVELRTLEPRSSRKPAPTGDDFRPLWQRYPLQTAGVAAAIAAVLLVAMIAIGHGGSKRTKATSLADTTSTSGAPTAGSDTTSPADRDPQTVATPEDTRDTASTPAPAPTTAPVPSSSNESSVARPVGPGSLAPISRTDGAGGNPRTPDRFAHPTGS